MDRAAWILVLALGTLLLSGALAIELVRAVWHNRPMLRGGYASIFCVLLGASAALVLPGPQDELLVASVSEIAATADSAAITIEMNGRMVRVSSAQPTPEGHMIWAVIEDVQTGALWLQGPAAASQSGWTLALNLGVDESHPGDLRYRADLATVPEKTAAAWLVRDGGSDVIRLSARPREAAWLARGIELRTP